MTLDQYLLTEPNRSMVVGDCLELLQSEVDKKTGLAGLAVKGAYTLIKRIKPTWVAEAIDSLLNDFVNELEPFYESFKGSEPISFEKYLTQRSAAVASALLKVTDRKAERARSEKILKAYNKLRPTGAQHVQAAVPGIGKVVEQYIS